MERGGLKQWKFVVLRFFYSFRSLKFASLGQNQGVGRATLPLAALGEILFLVFSSSWWWLALLDLWSRHSSLPLGSQGHNLPHNDRCDCI